MPREIIRLIKQAGGHAEFAQPLFAARDALEDHARVGALPDGFHLRGDVGQHAVLGGDLVAFDDLPQGVEHGLGVLHRIRHRIDADDRIPRAVGQPLVHLRHDGRDLVPRVVGLKPRGEMPRQAYGIVGTHDHGHFLRRENEIGVGHDLGYGGGHFRSEAFADALNGGGRGTPVQQKFPEFPDRPVPDALVDRSMHGILNDARHGVVFIRDYGMFAQVAKRQLAEHLLGGDAFLHGRGGNARQHIAGAQFPRLVQHVPHRIEAVGFAEKSRFQFHSVPQ